MFCRDNALLTEMLAASTVAVSCANENGVKAAVWALQEELGLQRLSCFRLFRQHSIPSVGVRPGRKLGPEEKSHIALISAVFPDRNVA